MPYVALLLLVLVSLSVRAETFIVHCPLGCPSNPNPNDLVVKHVYTLSNNQTTKFADWVAYEVNVLNFGDSPGREWASDPFLDDSQTLEEDDYSGAFSAIRVDRGHQAPLASFASSLYWPELNELSNITPQATALNQGPWRDLEMAVRAAVGFRESLYVFTGPLYESPMPPMPNSEPHTVPSGYWKIVYDLDGDAVGFVMLQSSARSDNYCSKRVPLDSISGRVSFSIPNLNESSAMRARLGC